MHDRIAELAGLRNELATCENGPRRASRGAAADDVRTEIGRVREELVAEAERLETHAEELAAKGQDVPAAEAAVAARAIRSELDDGTEQTAPKRTGKRNAAAAKAPAQT